MKHSRAISPSSKLIALNPFLDRDGVIRLGGRLQNAEISYSQRHPIILPSEGNFTKLIVMSEHLKNLHAGPQALLSIIRLRFWLLAGLRTVSKILSRCVVCYKVQPKCHEHLMGELPKVRVTPSRPFANCGVDYCGPFEIKAGKTRGQSFVKGYICLFICLSTKAVHLEMACDLSTKGFLNCFKRFIARRGLCQTIYSDNGTNFVGARNELEKLRTFLNDPKNQDCFAKFFADIRIDWKFIPPRSPHFGGIWEAAVRSAKYHLKRVLGNERLRHDEFNTIIAQVESCLNSRPLVPLTNNPEDLDILTPGHFLIGSSLMALPQEDVRRVNSGRLQRYQHLCQIVQHFWDKWSREYLSQLQQRGKWRTTNKASIQVGQLVIIKEDDVPPLRWQLGRITEVYPGADSVVRVAKVKTSRGECKRATSRLCVLPIDTSNDDATD